MSTRRAAGLAWLLASILASVSAAGGASAQQTPGDAPADTAARADPVEVVDVRFEGRDALGGDLIQDAIATQQTRCRTVLARPLCWIGIDRALRRHWLDEAETRRDVDRIETLYELWGYPRADVRLEIRRDGDEATVIFHIVEGPPLRVASLSVEAPHDVELPESLLLEPGDPYALPLLDASIDRIRWSLSQQGWPYAEVDVGGAVDADRLEATLVLSVHPGPLARFGEVEVRAEPPIDADVVRERLAFEPGDPYSDLALERTERALYDLPAIGRAVAAPVLESAGDSTSVPVVVGVAPRRLHGLEGEGTVSSTDCLELGAFWTHRYFLGRPRVFTVGGSVSNLFADAVGGSFPCVSTGDGEYARVDYAAHVRLSQPLPGRPRTGAAAELFAERHSTPGVFVQTGFGADLRLSHVLDFANTTSFALEYRPARYELDAADLYFCANYGVCQRSAIADIEQASWLSPVALVGAYRSDAALEGLTDEKLPLWRRLPPPRWRVHGVAALEAADGWTGSDFAYRRALLELEPTRRIGDAWELGGRLRGGLLDADGTAPPQARLYAGGPHSIRAAAQSQFGPAALVADPDLLDAIGCAPVGGGCPTGTRVDPDFVRLRPTGGELLLESSLEVRRWLGARVQAAVFVDFAALWPTQPWREGAPDAETLVAPGLGIRLLANIGAIRLDLAYDPRGAERMVLRSAAGADGELIELGEVEYDRYGYGDPGPLREFLRRLQLQVAIGQPF